MCVYGKAPSRRLQRIPVVAFRRGNIRNLMNLFEAVIHKQESRHRVPRSASHVVLSRTKLTLHTTRRTPHGASRLVQAMSAWVVKTRRAPSRHSRDARVYGHTTMAMHKTSTPPASSPPHPLYRRMTRRTLWRRGRAPFSCRGSSPQEELFYRVVLR